MIALELLAQAAIMAVVALGAWVAMGDGMVLHQFARFVAWFPSWISNPIAVCPRCMCSAWGIWTLIICGFGVGVSWNFELHILAIDWHRLAQLPVLILAAAGIQEMLHKP